MSTDTEKWKAKALDLAEEIADCAVGERHNQGMFAFVVERAQPMIAAALAEAYAEGHREGYRSGKWNENE